MCRIDHFFDTKEKRQCAYYLSLFILLAWGIVVHLLLGISLATMQNEQDLFGLLNKSILNYSFFAKVILMLMSTASFGIGKILVILFTSTTFYELVLMVMAALGLTCSIHKSHRRALKWILCIIFVMVILLGTIGMQAMHQVSFNTSLHLIQIMGVILMICMAVCLYITVAMIYRICLKDYPNAMEVEIVETYEKTYGE